MKNYQREQKLHEPVLKNEVIEALGLNILAHLKKRPKVIDATLGAAGHASQMVKNGVEVLGIEADPEMLEVAKERLGKAGSFKLVHGNFRKIDEIAEENSFAKVDGILFDLGISTPQLTSPTRGFSFQNRQAPLDMRIDKSSQGITAADLLNLLNLRQLEELFGTVLKKGQAREIAKSVAAKRATFPIKTVGDFLEIIEKIVRKRGRLHPATKAFLALRVAVNSELANLREALPKAFELLSPGRRLVVISFHSKEDEIVKDFFREMENGGNASLCSKKPIIPGKDEISKNPKSRSAKMRVLEKI